MALNLSVADASMIILPVLSVLSAAIGELAQYLNEAWELKESIDKQNSEFVITRYRDTNMNLRTQLNRIIKRAGLNPWPKPFQNLRSTRETELVEKYPLHVVCSWIGNSQLVAAKHYLQVTDDHFDKAVQNPVQQPAVYSRIECHQEHEGNDDDPDPPSNSSALQESASICENKKPDEIPWAGIEPTTLGLGIQRSILLSYQGLVCYLVGIEQ